MPVMHILQGGLFFEEGLPYLDTAGQSIRSESLVAHIKICVGGQEVTH